ncbi:MAG TPA: hypothetical protein VHV74_25400 [Pseudonocardiaceae bacterium]|jgi:hypothetical protein|nr:hypothetical protein [Pseudonocardiaceae bacterium]
MNCPWETDYDGTPVAGGGCPELLVDHDAPEERRIVIADDFGQRVCLSLDQLRVLATVVSSGALDPIVPPIPFGGPARRRAGLGTG